MLVLQTNDVLRLAENQLKRDKISYKELKVDLDFDIMEYDQVNRQFYLHSTKNNPILTYRNSHGMKIPIRFNQIRTYISNIYSHATNIVFRVTADDELMLENSATNDEAMEYIDISVFITLDDKVDADLEFARDFADLALAIKNESLLKLVAEDYSHLF
ncbi:hypothetical protein [Paenibacillus sp. Marseille-Q4541]|uniref:hypothetical protein n=1 Tax=Paenibacillus sp. Marseille-Q4541 TaxID=2831522 RepID=UPI001BA4F63F|nr:hypothetical protein [Paenibacillus sp. Marseille-Q4541]